MIQAPPSQVPILKSEAAARAVRMDDFEGLQQWLSWLRARGLVERTVQMYGYGVWRLFVHCRMSRLDQVTEDHISAFLSAQGTRSPARTTYYRGIRSAFGYWHRRGLIAADPTVGLTVRRPFRTRPVALTEEELIRFFVAAAWRSERRAWTLMLAFGLGARRMEIAGIRPDDLEGDVVHLVRCKYGKQRRVELSAVAKAALEGLRPWWNGTVLGGIGPATVTAWAHQAAKDAGLLPKVQHRPAHILRASFITHLLRNGVPVQVVKELVGHESISATNEYAATFSEDRREAVRRLPFGPTGLDTARSAGGESAGHVRSAAGQVLSG